MAIRRAGDTSVVKFVMEKRTRTTGLRRELSIPADSPGSEVKPSHDEMWACCAGAGPSRLRKYRRQQVSG